MLNPAGKARYPLCGDGTLEDDIDGAEKNMTVSEKGVQQLWFKSESWLFRVGLNFFLTAGRAGQTALLMRTSFFWQNSTYNQRNN